jgi:hypothetical protein
VKWAAPRSWYWGDGNKGIATYAKHRQALDFTIIAPVAIPDGFAARRCCNRLISLMVRRR